MKVVVAPDSYKGSISSVQVAEVISQAVYEVIPKAEIIQMPMADGGEGTLDALLGAMGGDRIQLECTGPLGNRIQTEYGIVHNRLAIVECALIAGLVQVPIKERNPEHTTSFGIGEVMKDALDRGCSEIIVGLGGSAVNDGGLGMLMALGMQVTNKNGAAVGMYGRDLHEVETVDFSQIDPRLTNISLKVACDVDNPLCGNRGATYVYGPQKGATVNQLESLDNAMRKYGVLVEAASEKRMMDYPGAGAAGGLGFALLALGATLVSGAALLAEAMDMEKAISSADLVFTGEGQSDEQTLYGKAPGYIAELANKHQVPVILLSGGLAGELDKLRERFSGCFSIANKPLTLEECMEKADELLYEQTKQIIHLIKSMK
ncbi:glycerate kinase [Ornithinibacillus contaminans]|uniref:glycerate kinase n=1 Tax=Ornithinibacillus contaminans TaxID=694055 RepID=UPI00064DE5E5|nr:glycerate kinase [Ornithinibacillus contaminans]